MKGLLVIGVVLLAEAALAATAPTLAVALSIDDGPACNGKYKGGLKPTNLELADIFKQHAAWMNDAGVADPEMANDPRRANLCGANLEGVQLKHADLKGANLTGADLEGADLVGAQLTFSDLESADLMYTHLEGAELYGANLKSAILISTHLEGADLSDAELIGADLDGANLTGVNLEGAHLTGAGLRSADLMNAHLGDADLEHAFLEDARLVGAYFGSADLVDAHLGGADLEDADLTDAKLTRADLSFANVADADFDFEPESTPKVVPGLYTAQNLQLVKFRDQPAGLVKLRKEFKDLGMRTQEAQLTYAIRRAELCRQNQQTSQGRFARGLNYVLLELGQCKEETPPTKQQWGVFVHSPTERGLNYVLFDLTCQYGMSPGRPLVGVVMMAVLFAAIYAVAQFFPGRRGGIWAVWEKERINKKEGSDAPQRLTSGFPSIWPRSWLRRIAEVFMLAAYFSLLSALRIGWSGLNFGTWISRIQPREYELRATGWVRVVSGVQSLISVYLVALAILTYFGTPFEY